MDWMHRPLPVWVTFTVLSVMCGYAAYALTSCALNLWGDRLAAWWRRHIVAAPEPILAPQGGSVRAALLKPDGTLLDLGEVREVQISYGEAHFERAEDVFAWAGGYTHEVEE